jgi:hypothetical protein
MPGARGGVGVRALSGVRLTPPETHLCAECHEPAGPDTIPDMRRELDSRMNLHGELVRLVWDSLSDCVEIELSDDDGNVRTAEVPSHLALDAFRHPYLYVDPTCLPALVAA